MRKSLYLLPFLLLAGPSSFAAYYGSSSDDMLIIGLILAVVLIPLLAIIFTLIHFFNKEGRFKWIAWITSAITFCESLLLDSYERSLASWKLIPFALITLLLLKNLKLARPERYVPSFLAFTCFALLLCNSLFSYLFFSAIRMVMVHFEWIQHIQTAISCVITGCCIYYLLAHLQEKALERPTLPKAAGYGIIISLFNWIFLFIEIGLISRSSHPYSIAVKSLISGGRLPLTILPTAGAITAAIVAYYYWDYKHRNDLPPEDDQVSATD